MADGSSAVVLDAGSGWLKAGFAGEDQPHSVIPSIIGHPTEAGGAPGPVGAACRGKPGTLVIHPIDRGYVQDWDDVEMIWQHIYATELHVSSSSRPVLLTEAPLNPKFNRERTTLLMFEALQVPSMSLVMTASLTAMACATKTGVVLNVGDGATHAVAIVDHQPDFSAIPHLDLAGHDVTDYLAKLLQAKGSVLDSEVVRSIKEQHAFVSLDPSAEQAATDKTFTLPDGQQVVVAGQERWKCAETLFSPSLLLGEDVKEEQDGWWGLPKLVQETINRHADPAVREELFGNIVLAGGSTMFPGLVGRMEKELTALSHGAKVSLIAPVNRHYSAWIGGSILASLSTFPKFSVSKAEYDEVGPEIVHRKC